VSGDEDHVRDHAHRPSRWGARRWLTLGGWCVAVVLGANLAWGRLHAQDGVWLGFLSKDAVLAALFWAGVAAAAAASVAGIVWTTGTYRRREKSSLLWTRHAFVFGVVAAAVLALVPRSPDGHWYVAWAAAALVAGQSALFAYAAYREHRRTVGSGGRRGRHGDDDGDGA
jgi:hypothetical protein